MNDFGLSSKNLSALIKIFKKHSEIERVMIFGSRATGRYKPGSDVDLALWQREGTDVIARLYSDLEDSTIPYFFDIVDFRSLEADKFKQTIERDGVVVYKL